MGEHVESKGTRPSVIVVGAGAGGVALAARLAAAGCKVTVVEKNGFSGGRCSLIHRKGYVGRLDKISALPCTHTHTHTHTNRERERDVQQR